MLKLFRRLKIRNQLGILALSVLLISLLAFLVTNQKISETIQANNTVYIEEIAAQTARAIDQSVADVGRIVTEVTYDPVVQQYLTESGDEEKYALSLSVNKMITKMINLKSGVKSILLLGFNGNLYGNLDSLKAQDRQVSLLENYTTPFCSGVYNDGLNTFLVIGSAIYDLERYGRSSRKIGVVAALVDTASLGANISLFFNKNIGQFYLFDRYQQVFETNAKLTDVASLDIAKKSLVKDQGTYHLEEGPHEYTVTVSDLESLGGKMVSVVNKEQLLSGVAISSFLVLSYFLISLAFCSFLLMLIVNNILRPLEGMTKFIGGLHSGNLKSLESRLHLEGYAEISQLADRFNGMLDEIDNLTERLLATRTTLYQTEILKQKSEYEYLKSQINPHFIFNTLESMKSISNLKGVYAVRDMSAALAKMLRYSIKGSNSVRVEEEIEIVDSYLKILSIRYKDKFEVVFDLPPEVMKAFMIKMILQPIVENSVYHGLELKLGKGLLKIEGRIEHGTDLVFSVIDNGVGIPTGRLSSLRKTLEEVRQVVSQSDAVTAQTSKEIGLSNVAKRIAISHGPSYGIQLESVENEGTTVILRIPYRRSADG